MGPRAWLWQKGSRARLASGSCLLARHAGTCDSVRHLSGKAVLPTSDIASDWSVNLAGCGADFCGHLYGDVTPFV